MKMQYPLGFVPATNGAIPYGKTRNGAICTKRKKGLWKALSSVNSISPTPEEQAVTAMCERNRLLRNLQMIDFALTEVNLFLDSHPNCPEALSYFRKYRDMREVAVADYEANVGPLTANGSKAEETWEWVCTPWPWELVEE